MLNRMWPTLKPYGNLESNFLKRDSVVSIFQSDSSCFKQLLMRLRFYLLKLYAKNYVDHAEQLEFLRI